MEGDIGRGFIEDKKMQLIHWIKDILNSEGSDTHELSDTILRTLISYSPVDRKKLINSVVNNCELEKSPFPNGTALLHVACFKGMNSVVEQLLQWEGEINLAVGDKHAIDYAFETRNLPLAKLLLENEAQVLTNPSLENSSLGALFSLINPNARLGSESYEQYKACNLEILKTFLISKEYISKKEEPINPSNLERTWKVLIQERLSAFQANVKTHREEAEKAPHKRFAISSYKDRKNKLKNFKNFEKTIEELSAYL